LSVQKDDTANNTAEVMGVPRGSIPSQIEIPTTFKGWLHEFWIEWCRQGPQSILIMVAALGFMWIMGLLPGQQPAGWYTEWMLLVYN
jgi:hypothetical protein